MSIKLSEQYNMELFSFYVYVEMATIFNEMGLSGFANWMEIQADEELAHAKKILKFLMEKNESVKFFNIENPNIIKNLKIENNLQSKFENTIKIFELALEHEKLVTQSINNIFESSLKEKDFATNVFIQWYITEQIEEENSIQEILDKLFLSNERGLLVLNKEMSNRTQNER